MRIVAPSMEITPDFVPAMIQAYMGWMTLQSEVAAGGASKRTMEKHAVTIGRLMPIVKKQSPSLRSGLDYEVTRLRGLKFVKFELFQHEDRQYLAGTTSHITITEWSNRKRIMGELGAYWIAIPLNIFVAPDLGKIHMIPMRNPQARDRHPHHYTRSYEQRSVREPAHPLDRETGNCFGDYSGTLTGLLAEPDLPGLFQQLYGHLSTYGNSPPRHMDALDFDHVTEEK